MSEAPPAARRANEAQLSQGADGQPAAFVMGGKVYLVASQLKNDRAVVRAMYHEALGHMGLRGVFGSTLNDHLDLLARTNSREVKAILTEEGVRHAHPEAPVSGRVPPTVMGQPEGFGVTHQLPSCAEGRSREVTGGVAQRGKPAD